MRPTAQASRRGKGGKAAYMQRGRDKAMTQRIEKPELVAVVAQRTNRDPALVAEITDAFLKEMVAAFKRGQSVSLRNVGSFYARTERESWVFKFNPAQRLRKLFGWTSTYRGEV